MQVDQLLAEAFAGNTARIAEVPEVIGVTPHDSRQGTPIFLDFISQLLRA